MTSLVSGLLLNFIALN